MGLDYQEGSGEILLVHAVSGGGTYWAIHMAKNEILVLGATGSTGRRLTGLLRAAGETVRVASRRGEVRFDWTDSGTWERAVAGASRM
jgi:NADPH:quinone reductase-like Zn-dependent oxidoreductase